jgi:predicted ATP-dependent endonuclease of OLD family
MLTCLKGQTLLGSYEWNLQQVNVLIGPNGSGKSLIIQDIKNQLGPNEIDYNVIRDYEPSTPHSVLKDLLSLTHLSKGQEQLKDILLMADYLVGITEPLLILDDAEAQLDIASQRDLINWVLEINPSIQLIFSSHSPTLYYSGWIDSVTRTSELLEQIVK